MTEIQTRCPIHSFAAKTTHSPEISPPKHTDIAYCLAHTALFARQRLRLGVASTQGGKRKFIPTEIIRNMIKKKMRFCLENFNIFFRKNKIHAQINIRGMYR